jgi:hypothetical protein
MPHATPVPHATFLLVIAGIVTIAVVAAAMVIARRALRAQITGRLRNADPDTVFHGRSGGDAGAFAGAYAGGAAAARADGVVRTLAERGLVANEQLASMSPAERAFFLSTVGARLGEGTKPRLMTQTHATGGAIDAGPATGTAATATATAAAIVLDPADDAVPHAALVSGSIHCPVCRAPIGKRADAPLLMSRCPGCSRRVAAHVDGDRLTVTLHYTLRTPAMGVPAIKVNG